MMRLLKLPIVFVVALCVHLPAQAGLLAPTVSVAGKTQNELAEDWWSWAANIPAASHPILDTTGQFAHLGDQGDVFFLGGIFGGGDPVNRTVTVSATDYLFFPLLNSITWDAYSLYPDDFERDLIETMGDINSLFAQLNGNVLGGGTSELLGWLQQSPDDFDLEIKTGGLFNQTGDAPGIRKAQQRGYYLALEPLPVGTHVLKFGGKSTPNGGYAGVFPPNIQDITYTITVVPEPGTLGIAALGSAGLIALARRRRSSAQ